MLDFESTLSGRTILVTGHTGFTGSWVSLWLSQIGCRVVGISLPPNTTPNLYGAASIGSLVEEHLFDIADAARVRQVIENCRPDVVLHLAAQPLVSQSFADPVETFRTNILGTAHVLEAARHVSSVKAAVCVTTDKVYKDRDWHWGYRETDELGGKDPYSASKSCAEMIIASYQQTLVSRGNGLRVAAARGGNIIGGGDWSANRIVPDFVRAVLAGKPLVLRNPESTRPWQHVLALSQGYLQLAAVMLGENGAEAARAWNFGPGQDGARTVRDLVTQMGDGWRHTEIRLEPGGFPETRFLHLDSLLARRELGWNPPLAFAETVALTAGWYKACTADPATTRAVTLAQIADYRARLAGAA
jgi:CDP-glucose 4,6-dehydratase